MKIFVTLILLANSQLVLEDTQKEYNFQPTLYGFIPYGGQIRGHMEFVKDLCKTPESTNKIIITEWSKECKTQQQLWNADQSMAIIFSAESINERELLSERYSELDTILLMAEKDIAELKKNDDSRVHLRFPIKTKLEKPVIEYIVYELVQTTEVLKLLQEFQKKGFNFYLNVLYFTTHRDDIEQLCSAQATDANPYVIVFGDKVNCHSEFEKRYLIAGNLTKIDRSSVLRENVLQMCVLQLYGQDKWLQYRTEFRNYILASDSYQTMTYQARSFRQQQQMDETKIQQCQTASFSSDNKINSILQEQDGLCFGLSSNHYRERATLVINGNRIFGNYTQDPNYMFNANTSGLFLALCEAYHDKNRPQACPNKTLDVIVEQPNNYLSNNLGFGQIGIVVSVAAVILILLRYLLKQGIEKFNICCDRLLGLFRRQQIQIPSELEIPESINKIQPQESIITAKLPDSLQQQQRNMSNLL